MDDVSILLFRCFLLFVLVGFLPVCAFTYFSYRIGQRRLEIERILRILDITSEHRETYVQDIGKMHYFVSVMFTIGIAVAGLSALLLNNELGLANKPSLLLAGTQLNNANCDAESACLINYQHGALLAFGLGFMGAYIWGLQGIFRRYSMNDLLPIAFFHFGLRMIIASFIALLIYHAVGGFSFNPKNSGQESQLLTPTSDGILIATVFLIGMFPQQGLRWLSTKLGVAAINTHPSARKLPLTMIEGMTSYDIFRLEELGIDSCYDLANSDFIPLLLKTSYGSRELIDWLLQAKLCIRFGESVEELRVRGIRIITDFTDLDDEYLEGLANETTLTLSGLKNAKKMSVSDNNIERLKRAAELLGQYWEGADKDEQLKSSKQQK